MPVSFTPEQLEECADQYVVYEVSMLCDSAKWLHNQPNRQGVEHNSVLEALLVHARLLDVFLGTPAARRQKDDVLAVDYGSPWEPKYALSDEMRNAINAQVAHLAMRRTQDKMWQTSAIARDVARNILAFCETLDEDWRTAFYDAESCVDDYLLFLTTEAGDVDSDEYVLEILHGS